ncbi:MAG TPA: cupin domain-containing protein [Thermoleophilaceae bacterium]
MARPGETIDNPSTGERITFLRTREETGGDVLEFEVVLERGARIGGFPHRHPVEERFVVEEGVFATWVAGRGRRTHGPGDEVVIPPLRGHLVWNAGETEARAIAEARPADDIETMFETFFGIAADGGGRLRGAPPPLHSALLAHTYELYVPLVPVALQKPLLALLARAAENRGYEAVYSPRPVDPEGPSHVVPPPGGPGDLRTARTESFVASRRERVWRLLTDPERYEDWVFGVSDFVDADAAWPDPGSSAKFRHGIGPASLGGSYTILHEAEPSELELQVRIPPLIETRKRFDLTETPDGTHVTLRETPVGGALARISVIASELLVELAGTLSLFALRRLLGSAGGLRARSAGSAETTAIGGAVTT